MSAPAPATPPIGPSTNPPANPPALGWRVRGELLLARLLKRWYGWRRPALPPWQAPPAQLWQIGAPAAPAPAPIPRILWTYWDSADPPPLIERCLASWRQHHPHWRIEVLDLARARALLPHLPVALLADSPQKLADWLRLALLQRHGGIWLDASTILTAPLDWVLQAQQAHGSEYLGFYLQRFTTSAQYPVVENWFMAAAPGSAFVHAWQREFDAEVVPRGNSGYLQHLQALGLLPALQQAIDAPEYLSMHLAAQRVLQRDDAHYRLTLWPAEASAFAYHVQAGWQRARLKKRLLFMQAGPAVAPLIKLRAPDRRKLEHYLAAGLYLPASLADRYLMAPPASPTPDHDAHAR
ncbi:mannosyltransferase [Vandammella animalimorsus]|uniref:Mannosyltransferase n=1 Tax=Vandammella animalimorsus TaxID=2029117 RepID=A0A2A2AV98_9BURK|nr:capsular polysaccharide synthesis protein [Vandammella animalimorsus]PAT41658.1 mannosyltransferase [Vandammella animalimorsus]